MSIQNRAAYQPNSQTSRSLIRSVIGSGYDFEWYPTTDEIINCIKLDMDEAGGFEHPSILDCGAGDGRVLNALDAGRKYAIEISRPLLDILPRDIFIVGTDFEAQTLLDKRVDIIFSNPPYLQYVNWATKIITEGNADVIYLVLPERWIRSESIHAAVKLRSAEAVVVGTFDFENAERKARAKVNVVRIDLGYRSRYNRGGGPKTDPFAIWFNENFKVMVANERMSDYEESKAKRSKLEDSLSGELVKGRDIISVLDELYQNELSRLINTYKTLEELEPSLLSELDVDLKSICKSLRLKIGSLKDRYWKELFDGLDKITNRLTSSSREKLLSTLTSHTHVDFSPSNAYAVVVWVIKSSNFYYEDQLVDAVETMVERANISMYKSNKKTFGDEEWRYCSQPRELDRFKLEYRIVLTRTGGLCTSEWSSDQGPNGISKRAARYLEDLATVATNLGFNTAECENVSDFHWDTHIKNEFTYIDTRTGERMVLFEAKCYRNGNTHLKLNLVFIARLNVEFGRIKRWIKSPQEAAQELDISLEQASLSFKSNLQLEDDSLIKLGFSKAV